MNNELSFSEAGKAPLEGANVLTGEDAYWLHLSRSAWEGSTDYFNSSVRRNVEDSLAMFFNNHPGGSKYYTEAFRKRSKLFRPKTRIATRNLEAAANISMFSTPNMLACGPVNANDPMEILGARVTQKIINYRLKKTIPWYKICTAGVQDGLISGVILSKQSWEFREVDRTTDVEYRDRNTGSQFFETETKRHVIKDGPRIDLTPLEQLKFDPAAPWYDPMGESPYLVHESPWYVYELKEQSKSNASGVKFRSVTDRDIFKCMSSDFDSLRRRRDNDRVDRYTDQQKAISDFQIVWVREYIMDRDGEDWVWWTLGGEMLLSDPVPMVEAYAHGRPWKMGMPIIEAHRLYPSSPIELIKPMQEEANEIANLRLDNIKQAVLRRWVVERNAGVDTRSLQRGVAGGIIMADNVNAVRPEAPNDVTRSIYEEQDRLNLDIDDMTGSMSAGTVMSQRSMNETAKGMDLTFGAANQVQEFLIRTTMETWVRDVMNDLVAMEGHYETDETIIRIAASENDVSAVEAFRSLGKDIDVEINVSYGAMTPEQRISKIRLATQSVAEMAPTVFEGADQQEIAIDVMAAAGIQAKKYFPALSSKREDPQIQKLQETIQQLTQIIESKQVEIQGKKDVAVIQGEYSVKSQEVRGMVALQVAELELSYNSAKLELERERLAIDSQLADVTMLSKMSDGQMKRQQLLEQRRALNQNIMEAERQFKIEMAQLILQGTSDGSLSQGPMALSGNDRAGTIARNDYDLIPGATG